MRWQLLAIGLGIHIARLFLRSYAWQTILRAAYPTKRVRYWHVTGAYFAGVGVNSIVPARAGDAVKLVLMKHRIRDSSYATLTPTLVAETVLDFFVAGAFMVWALAIGVLPAAQVYAHVPSVDWRWFFAHPKVSGVIGAILLLGLIIAFFWARLRYRRFRENVAQGFAIFHDRERLIRGVFFPQALSWVLRVASVYYFLEAFQVHASIHNALLVLVVDSLSTLFPATPGGAGTKQGLIAYVFHGKAMSQALLLAFSVGMNIAVVACNVVLGAISLALMTGTLHYKKVEAQRDESGDPKSKRKRAPDSADDWTDWSES